VGEPDSLACVNALLRKELSYCYFITDPTEADICILAYVGLTSDTLACVKIEDKYLKNECYK